MKFPERKVLLKIPVYQQTLPTSCGAACLLMVGNFFKPQEFPLKREKELEIHQKIKYWEGDTNGEFANVAKMIRFMRENGFKVRYFLEFSPKIFIPPPDFEETLWKRYVNSFFEILNQEKKRGLEIVERANIDVLLNEVRLRRPVICETIWEGYITHFWVIRGFKGGMVYVVDPMSRNGYKRMGRKWIQEKIDLGHGKNFFSVYID